MFVKTRLMTPGPTQVAEATRIALGSSHPHHRGDEFKQTFMRVQQGLSWLWETEQVLLVTGSGTAGMEAAMRSTIPRGARIAVATGGKFADRWLAIAQSMSSEVVVLDVEYGRSASAEDLRAKLVSEAPLDAFVCVASETSTGALHPIPELCDVVRAHSPDALTVIDGITAVGCVDLSMSRHAIDVLVSGSQKAFGVPPGAAFVGMSERAWDATERADAGSFYLDLRRERGQATAKTAFTPTIPVVLGLVPVLEQWQAAGRKELLAHSAALATATRAAVAALGLERFARDTPSPALTSVTIPEIIGAERLRTRMREQYGCSVVGGQDAMKDRILRLGHLGAVDAFDVISMVSALELALRDFGHGVEVGVGVAAALASLAQPLSASRSALYAP